MSRPVDARDTDLSELIPARYRVAGTGPDQYNTVYIDERIQRDGRSLWVVSQLTYVLSADGEWEYEPLPSSRTDEFIARTRFASPSDALAAYRALPQEGRTP